MPLSKNVVYVKIEEGDEIAVYSFDWYRQGAYIFPETEGFTNDKDKIISAVNNIKPKTNLIQPQVGSDINQALMETLKLLGEKNDSIPTAIFLFSDELDNIPADTAKYYRIKFVYQVLGNITQTHQTTRLRRQQL